MSALHIIKVLSNAGIFLFVENGKLKTRAPEEAITDSIATLIKENRDVLIHHLLEHNQPVDQQPIPSNSLTEAPLSYSQQRLWLTDQIDGSSAHYNLPGVLKLSGNLDELVLEKAFCTLIERHESLRTVYKLDDLGGARQYVNDNYTFEVSRLDLTHLESDTQFSNLEAHIAEESIRPFKLDSDLMIRATLIKISGTENILLVTLHHISADGWSMAILIKEFCALYKAISLKEKMHFLPVTKYLDYAIWQQMQLTGKILDAGLHYWSDNLKDLPLIHNLPTDYPRPRIQSYVGRSHRSFIDASTSQLLKDLCKSQGVTLFMGLHAAFSVLLSRYSNELDIAIGCPIANRERADLVGTIGFFVNTLVLRSGLSEDDSFISLLEKSKENILNAYKHQWVPFEKIVEKINPSRSLSYSPLFQVMLVLQNNDSAEFLLPELTASMWEQPSYIAKYDLTLSVNESVHGFNLDWEFSSSLFDTTTIERMSGHFALLLRSLVESPFKNVFDVKMLGDQESQELIQLTSNEIIESEFLPRTLHAKVMEQIELRGSAIAIRSCSWAISYKQLGDLSRNLRNELARRDNVNNIVAVVMEKGWEQIVAVLGILRSGHAYLPIDAHLPMERIKVLLEIAGVSHLITTPQFYHSFAESLARDVIVIGDPRLENAVDNIVNYPEALVQHSDLAYVIFTSGSTGVPKGVKIDHQGAANTIDDICQKFDIDHNDSILALSNLNFDLSVFDIFGLLGVGGTVVLPQQDEINDPAAWLAYIARVKITLWNTVPAFVQLLTEMHRDTEPCTSIRLVLMSGDWIPTDLPSKISARLPCATQISLGGATEASIWSIYYPINNVSSERKSIPYGKALKNQQMYVLQKDLSLCPLGVIGDIYIGGVGLSLGYLGDDISTKKSFIQHPVSGKRLYKTGDLGRLLRDGNIEFLGRADHQIKVRGFRIELGEIEHALNTYEGVKDCVIVVKGIDVSDKCLIAYVVLEEDLVNHAQPNHITSNLRRYLGERLPDYMIPTAFSILDALPLSANGKVDRKALPEVVFDQSQQNYIAPTTEMEKLLCSIWREVLNIEQVSTSDNFFQLGGHSILVMQVIARLQQHGINVGVRQIFAAQHVSDLAKEIENYQNSFSEIFSAPKNRIIEGSSNITPDMLPLVELSQDEIDTIVDKISGGVGNVQDIYPLGPLQEGILYHHLLSPNSDPYVLPGLFSIKGNDSQIKNIIQGLQFIVNRHDVLRTAIFWNLSTPVQVVCRHIDLPVVWVEDIGEQSALQFMQTLASPDTQFMDLGIAPLIKLHIIKSEEGDTYFALLQLHHIISDHMGLAIIQHELHAYLTGNVKQLIKPIPYREFVAHAHYQAAQNNAETFFRNNLGDVNEPTLPFNISDIRKNGGHVNEVKGDVPAEMSSRLRQLAKALQVSPAAFFHLAWGLVVSATSGRNDVIFGTVLSGRLQGTVGAEYMLGNFINTLPVRIKLEESVEALLLDVHNALIALLPYEQSSLVLAQGCSNLPSETPLFGAILNYRFQADDSIQAESTLTDTEIIPTIEYIGGQERTNYPFSLSVNDLGKEFSLELQIDSSIEANRILDYMQTAVVELVSALMIAPQKLASSISVISDIERAEILQLSGQINPQLSNEYCIHQLFEIQTDTSPDAIAVIFGDESYTYETLNKKANQLANYLLAHVQIQPDDLVGICLDRSLNMLVGMLAILKTGAAYVPLDPEYPMDRLAYMLGDAVPKVILTTQKTAELAAIKYSHVLYLDDEQLQQKFAASPAYNPILASLSSKNLAYVIYTSGSTGKPKGVMVEHGNVVNFLRAMQSNPGIKSNDCLLAVTSTSFDIHGLELFLPLITGATIILASRADAGDPHRLIALISKHGVSFMQATPATWKLMVDVNWQPGHSIKLLSGGESISRSLGSALLSLANVELWNMYGPTETTIWSCCNLIADNQVISIGRPIANTSLYIATSDMQLAPKYVAGELLIGGAGVARGYLHRPELTAEKFIKNTLVGVESPSTNDVLYKTGDLVRWLPDGNLEFLGRIDQQVKIHGFRIELGEIESVLAAHHHVKDCIVEPKRTTHGDTQLIAYIILEPGLLSVDANDVDVIDRLRQHLSQTLPHYMLPSAYMLLDNLPLTPNGKVDRKALPEPNYVNLQREYVAPQTKAETLLCEILQDLLRIDRVGLTDNFFQIGGHSIMAVQLVARIEKVFGRALPLILIMSAPTVAEICSNIEKSNLLSENFTEIVPNTKDRHEPFPLTDIQRAYWLGRNSIFEMGNISTHGYLEIPLTKIDFLRLEHAINSLIRRHDMLRMIVTPEGQQKIIPVVPDYALEMHDLTTVSDSVAKSHILDVRDRLSHQVFVTSEWPLFDVRLSRLSKDRSILHVSIDTLLVDASSLSILTDELSAYYHNPEVKLDRLELSFRDYVLAEQSMHSSIAYQQSKNYWLSRIEDFPARPMIPLAVDPADIKHPKFTRRIQRIHQKNWNAIKKIAKEFHITPTSIVIGCLSEVLNFWSESAHFAINLTLFNRFPIHPQVNNIVGDFTTVSLLEIDLRNIHNTFADNLSVIQKQLWTDLEHRHFNGVSMQQQIMLDKGFNASYPIVFTSTLGFDAVNNQAENIFDINGLANTATSDDVFNGFSLSQTSQVWLDIQISEVAGDLLINWDSVDQLFPNDVIDNMFSAMINLLDKLSINKSQWQQTICLNVPEIDGLLIERSNSTEISFTANLLHSAIWKYIDNTPQKRAVRCRDVEISYGELGLLSGRLASHLSRHGATPNTLIAIVMEKGWEQIVAVLGVLAAGAAYLPIDALQPKDRILKLLALGEVSQVVTTTKYRELVPVDMEIYEVDRNTSMSGLEPLAIINSTPSDLAYVIFTSGSSGEPKGVSVSHLSALNTIESINRNYTVHSSDVIYGLSNFNFDLSVYDIFGVLGVGGTLVLPLVDECHDPKDWIKYLLGDTPDKSVTLWNSVPVLMQLLVDECERENIVLPLRLVMMSGDWISTALPKQIKNIAPLAQQISLGGATEASIWSIAYPIEPNKHYEGSIPYGKPLSNQKIYVLKENLSFAPIFTVGDLYIAGIGLAEGYWRDDIKTNASFIRHPITCERLYRTGDRGRLLPDGNIEFLGRSDFQVKIRGFRIELGEIESALTALDNVKNAVVITTGTKENQQLVAYIVLEAGAGTEIEPALVHQDLAEELRYKLSQQLPDYMVPSLFINLHRLPLTSNGKLDRKLLPHVELSDDQTVYCPPVTEIEKSLCNIWEEILEITPIGINENFFKLGGNSLLIIKLLRSVESQFKVSGLKAKLIFQFSDIKSLAAYINLLVKANSSDLVVNEDDAEMELFQI